MKLKVNFIDAFTDVVFEGNPAAVIVTDKWLSKELMQAISVEHNLSETAFVVKDGQGIYHIRWFSPLTEIDFCGHATLASAFVLFDQFDELTTLKFSARSVGEFEVKRINTDSIQMSFPNRKPKPVSEIPNELINGLSIMPEQVLLSEQAYFAIYQSEDEVKAVKQNKDWLKKLAPYDVVVTSPSEQFDFISRYFWPANGGDEDPVTGSIHAGLAPYWAEVLNKNELVAFQASKRGGHLLCQLIQDRVLITGKAVRYLEGEIDV